MIAEMDDGDLAGECGFELQWGRDLMIAEICRRGRIARRAVPLQWGRDLMIAEISMARI